MHELSYVVKLAKQAAAAAEANGAKRVEEVDIVIGEMTGLVPEYMKRYWPSAVSGTILEGSELKVDLQPVEFQCSRCGKTYHPSRENNYLCPDCRISSGRLLHGREFMIRSIIIDD